MVYYNQSVYKYYYYYNHNQSSYKNILSQYDTIQEMVNNLESEIYKSHSMPKLTDNYAEGIVIRSSIDPNVRIKVISKRYQEMKIAKLETIIANARLIDNSTIDNSKVFILSNVKIKNVANGMEMAYTLVAENEADLKAKKISVDSPIGKGLLGKAVGEIADVQTPNGIVKFEIIDITR
jgi:hypothetical protein